MKANVGKSVPTFLICLKKRKVQGSEVTLSLVRILNAQRVAQADALRERTVKRSVPNAGLYGKPEIHSTGLFGVQFRATKGKEEWAWSSAA